MKKIYLLAAAAALFAACSSEKDSLETQQQPTQLEESAVGFDVYTQKAVTRGGWTGSLTTAQLKQSETPGFGVFGYYTDNNDYEQRATPNFFYNQLVAWNGATGHEAWEYAPIKYWPNEYGNDAKSDDADKVTYFAYAPYVEVVPTSGKLAKKDSESDADFKDRESWGITGMTKNSAQGDPVLKYIGSFNPNKSVDLCWGVADNNDGIWPTVQAGSDQKIDNGTPWLNVLRPVSTDKRVKFTFKHALAQMKVNIDAIVDEIRQGTPTPKDVDSKTRIWVRQVNFKGFTMKGALNLNNDDDAFNAKWLDYNGTNELVSDGVTVYDGRKDGKEGVAGAVATNEKVLGLNPALVQDGIYESGQSGKDVYEANKLKVLGVKGENSTTNNLLRTGVTAATVNLFNMGNNVTIAKNENIVARDGIFHVIPVDEEFEIEIVYDVETVSENLALNLSDGQTKGTSIENRIRKTVSFGDAGGRLKAGHSYTLNMHLGMNSVKLDAAVTGWIEEAAQDVDLPLNAPMFAAAGADLTATIPYDAETYTFAIYGLEGGESMDAAWSDWKSSKGTSAFTDWEDFGSTTKAKANAGTNGIAIETIKTSKNNTVNNRIVTGTWTPGQSGDGKKTIIKFTQLAHPLGLYAGEQDPANEKHNTEVYAVNKKTITLKSAIAGMGTGWMNAGLEKNYAALTSASLSADNPNKCGIKVKRNGVPLKWAANTDAADTFTFGNNSGDINLKDAIQVGDVYEVTLKTGDAAEETISIKIVAP
jgi:hypothetical protein